MSSIRHLRANEIALIVNQIIEILFQLREQTKENDHEILEYLRIDIKLLKKDSEYSIKVTNCGKWKTEYFTRIMKVIGKFCDKIIFKNEQNSFCGTIVNGDLQSWDKMRSVDEEFSYFKEYLSVELKPKLSVNSLDEFSGPILERIHALKDLHSSVKFTFKRDSKILYSNDVEFENDYKMCSLVGFALSNIVKQSQREEFRKKSFHLFGANNYEDLDYAIKTSLLSQIHSNIGRKST